MSKGKKPRVDRSQDFKNKGKTFEARQEERKEARLAARSAKRQKEMEGRRFEDDSDEEQPPLVRAIAADQPPEIRVSETLASGNIAEIVTLFEDMKDNPALEAAFKKVVSERFAGVEINRPIDDKRNTLLHYAAIANYEEVVVFLLARGADANVQNRDGDLALSVNLIQQGTFEADEDLGCARLLLDKTDIGRFGKQIVEVCRNAILNADGDEADILQDCFYYADLAQVYEKTTGEIIPDVQSEVDEELLAAFGGAAVRDDGAAAASDDDDVPEPKVRRGAVAQVEPQKDGLSHP